MNPSQGDLFTRAGTGLIAVYHGSTAVADFDGDGTSDLVVTGEDASNDQIAKVYLGNGDGSFIEKTDAGLIGVEFSSTAVADFDDDGTSDLVVTGLDASRALTAMVYLGSGDGSFTEKSGTGLTGVYYGSTSVADFDGDGTSDLVVTGRNASDAPTGTVYLGNGDGSFTEKSGAGLTDAYSGSTSVAEFDGDGIPDLVVTGRDASVNRATTVYLGNGDGSFTEKANPELTDVDYGSTAVADFDGDGTSDLVVTGEDASNDQIAKVYLGNGDGSFIEKTDAGLIGVDYGSTAVADFDDDGTSDLVVTGLDASRALTAMVYLGSGNGSFTVADVGLTGIYRLGSTSTGDLDGDGDFDLVITGLDDLYGSMQPSTRVYVNRTVQTPPNRTPSWVRTPSDVTIAAGTPLSLYADASLGIAEAGDLDGDRLSFALEGPVNASVTDAGSGVAQINFTPERSQSGHTFSLELTVSDPDGASVSTSFLVTVPSALAAFDTGLTGVYYGSTAVADFDGDGTSDLVVTGLDASGAPTTVVYLGNGDGSFTEKPDAGLPDTESGFISIADVDGNDIPDLVLTTQGLSDPPIATVYLGNGDGSFTKKTDDGLTDVYGSTSVTDFDGDGTPDIVVTGENVIVPKTATVVYLGNGDGSFTEKADAGLTDVYFSSTSAADFNGDGTSDLVVTGRNASDAPIATVYLGNGDGSFTEKTDAGLTDVDSGSTAVADFDGDGTSDLVVTGLDASGAPTTVVYLGNGDGSFTEKPDASLTGVYLGSTSVADFNGDAASDLLVTGDSGSNTSTAMVYLGNGDGTFTVTEMGLPAVDFSSTSVADFDGNGTPDLLVSGHGVSDPITLAYENLGGSPLPVELVQFEARRTGNDVTLTWGTASETNNTGFRVEHQGPDADSFVKTGFIEGHGTTNKPQTYSFSLSELETGRHQFRLRQMDLDGTSTLSETVEVDVGLSAPFVLNAPYPNPTTQSATLDLTVQASQTVRITMYNVLGQRVATLYNDTVTAERPLALTIDSHPLSGGLYFVHLEGERFQATRRLTVVR